MNHAFLIAQRRARRVTEARTPAVKRNHILFCLDALRERDSINDGNGIASPDSVSAVRRVTAVTHSPNSGEQQ